MTKKCMYQYIILKAPWVCDFVLKINQNVLIVIGVCLNDK